MAGKFGLHGRSGLLALLMAGEGLGLLAFYGVGTVGPAIAMMLVFGLFTHMSCGAIYALSPFIDRKALGGVSGIIGAGGNVGGVAAGFLLKATGSLPQSLFILGCVVLVTAVCVLGVRFSAAKKAAEQQLYDEAVARRYAGGGAGVMLGAD